MGTTETALRAALTLALLLVSRPVAAECVERKGDETFATCFDVGNQLFVTASSDGFGAGGRLRHVMRFEDEPDLVWKLDHRFANLRIGGLRSDYDGALYTGRFLRQQLMGPLGLTDDEYKAGVRPPSP